MMDEFSQYFNDPNHFTNAQWEKMQKRKALCGISTEAITRQKENPKTKRHNALKSARRNWMSMR